jgi:hypothetical protein
LRYSFFIIASHRTALITCASVTLHYSAGITYNYSAGITYNYSAGITYNYSAGIILCAVDAYREKIITRSNVILVMRMVGKVIAREIAHSSYARVSEAIK